MRAIDADALMDYFQMLPIDLGYREVEDIKNHVREMPTIEPERKKGKWIKRDVHRQIHGISCSAPNWQCSVCKKWWFHNGEGLKWYKFCPECGADMRGDDHDL